MTIQDAVRVARAGWLIIVSAVVIGAASGGAIWLLSPPEYTANMRLYVSAQLTDSPVAAYQGSLLSQQRVLSYVQLVESTRVARDVAADLGLPDTGSPAWSVAASAAPDSVLIDVAVIGDAPERVGAVANSLGRVFGDLVAELERPTDPASVPPVVVRVVDPAEVPTAPSSTGLPTSMVLGLLLGAVMGVGIAFLRNAFDTSITTAEQLLEVSGAPTLATIAYDTNIPKRPLTLHENPQSPRAEVFRQLRTNLTFVDVDSPRKVILVTSAMPGEGKTTSVCNLAIALAATECRVLVIEADLRRPRLADLLGFDRSVGLTDVLSGRLPAQQAVQSWAGGRFDVLASGPLPPNPSELLGSRQMAGLLGELRQTYEYVLLDSPPLLPVTDAAALAPATDGVIVVCRHKVTSRGQLSEAVQALAAVSARLLGTVFTMVPVSGSPSYANYSSYHRPTSRSGRVREPDARPMTDRAGDATGHRAKARAAER